MAKVEENREKRCHTMQMNGFSRDLMHKLEQISNENEEEEDDIELSLGLSLNGRFGVDPQRVKRLKRSSSVANFVFGTNEENCNNNNGCSFSYVPIVRTCSLPVEAQEECRKRKELQSLRRLEAKRKRMEKLQNNVKVVVKQENGNNNGNGNNSLQLSQGSIGSQGSGSSGISDFGSQPIQGPGDTTGTNTPTTIKSEHEQKQVATQPEHTSEKSPSICETASKEAKEMFKNFMLNMPCVSTKGDGPNGKKIEGFLYRYQKGEEVKIVCVCHGNFLSPAEFIKHGGGGDVENPLRHIVVSPAPLLG